MKITKKDKTILGVATLITVTSLIVFDLSPFGGNIQFYTKWIDCGKRPLEATAGFAGSVPHYYEGAVFAPMRSKKLFCTPGKAERAGYSSNEHSWQQDHIYAE